MALVTLRGIRRQRSKVGAAQSPAVGHCLIERRYRDVARTAVTKSRWGVRIQRADVDAGVTDD